MAEQAQPLVSVIMPAYNAAAYVEAAIRSVIGQTITDWELIVIDDRSADESYNVIQRLAAEDERIRAFRNPQNMGVARTRNFGIEQACGQFIAFLDSDDIWHADKLEKQLALAKETGAGIVYCSYAIMNAQGGKAKEDYIVPAKTDFEHLLRENVILCSAMMVRAEILKKIPFNTEFFHEDFVLALDIMKAGYAAVGYTEVLMKWRYIDNSRSFDKRKAAQNRWKVYRDYLKLPFAQSAIIFLQYALAGLKKYR